MAESQSRIEDGAFVGAARQVESAAGRAKEYTTKKLEELTEGSRTMIRDNPMKSVLIAAGVGALIGFLVARKRS